MTPSAPHGPVRDVRYDPFTLAGVVVWVACNLPSWVPILPPEATFTWGDQYGDVPSLLLVVAAAWMAGRHESNPARRTFWLSVRLAMISWTGVRVLFFLVPWEEWGVGFDLGSDVLYISAYVLLGIGLEVLRTDMESDGEGGEPGPGRSASERSAILVFSFFTLAFLVLSPGFFSPELYASGSSSMLLYVTMDAWLMVRAAQLTIAARRDDEWRRASTWLLITCATLLIGDAVEGLIYIEVIPWLDAGTPWDTIWNVPPLTLFLAARAVRARESRVAPTSSFEAAVRPAR